MIEAIANSPIYLVHVDMPDAYETFEADTFMGLAKLIELHDRNIMSIEVITVAERNRRWENFRSFAGPVGA